MTDDGSKRALGPEFTPGGTWHSKAHAPHRGKHEGYACGFSGPHCWECHEPWPCRAERGVDPTGGREALREALDWCIDYIAETRDRTRPPEAEPFLSERLARYRALGAPPTPGNGLDAVYRDRNLVVQAYAEAMESLDYHVAWGVDENEPDWPVLYIETPYGQVSWHIPKVERIYEPPDRTGSFGPVKWDGHTDAVKFDRLRSALTRERAEGDGT